MIRALLSLTIFIAFSSANQTLLAEDGTGQQRIISLAPHITEVLFAVGAGDEVVGVVSYSDYPQEALAIPLIGSYDKINYEAVLALRPTLVFGWNSGNGEDVLERLRELGLEVYGHEPVTLEDVGESLRVIGELSGHTERGAEAADSFSESLQALRQKYAKVETVRLYYQLWNEPQMTVNDDHLISDVIRLCGGKNIFADAIPLVPKVSVETVILRDPEAIVATGMAEERPEWLDDWKRWDSITAVKNNQLYHVNPDYLHRHGPRILDGAEQLCLALDQARKVL